MPPDGIMKATGIQPLCLFPTVFRVTRRGEAMALHQGSAVFVDSHVWVQDCG